MRAYRALTSVGLVGQASARFEKLLPCSGGWEILQAGALKVFSAVRFERGTIETLERLLHIYLITFIWCAASAPMVIMLNASNHMIALLIA